MSVMGRSARVVLWVALTLLALGGWVALVLVAIDEGRAAREGGSGHVGVLVTAVVGAIVLLLLAAAFVRRLLIAVGVIQAYQPKRAKHR
jgi:energy-converting hydrogenase Eha subunit B